MKPGCQRVLMTADPVGGVFTYALDLVAELGCHGVQVILATMGRRLSREQERSVAALANCQLHQSRFRLEWMNNPWHDLALAGDWLLELARNTQPDIVHLNGYAHAGLAWPAPVLVVGHSCVLSWWRAVKGEPAPARWQRYRQVVGAGLAAADLVVTPSRAMLKALQLEYGPLGASRVIHNGRRISTWPAATKADFIFAAGRLWDEAKNILALEKVAGRLSWPILAAGETTAPGGGPAVPIQRQLRALGPLAPREMNRLFQHAAIYALPVRYEPFGLTALEAGLHGCALVLGDIPSQHEIWGAAAQFVPPDDLRCLEKVLRELIEQPDKRQLAGCRARQRALELSPRRMGDAYLAAYNELLCRRQEVRCAA